ncbi:MAG: HAD-IA family hydrolase, partial [Candidatus Thorarchaeota archaeon]
VRKPNVEFFNRLVQRLGEIPQRILFIDDLLINIKEVRKVGLVGIHYKGKKDLLTEIRKYMED